MAVVQSRVVKVVMPKNTPNIKVENGCCNGGEIIRCEPKQESDQVLKNLLNETGSILIHPYNDENIIAGQGTTSKEMLEDNSTDIIISPVSGGGLLSGTLICSKYMKSDICKYMR